MGTDDEYYDHDLPQDECDCEDYDADILTGVATCVSCGRRWIQTAQEIERERDAQSAYDKLCEQPEPDSGFFEKI